MGTRDQMEALKKKKQGGQGPGSGKERDVFDLHGNDFLREEADTVREESGDVDEEEDEGSALKAAMGQDEDKEEAEEEDPKMVACMAARKARMEVILMLQQLQGQPDELKMIGELSPEKQATQVLEYLGEFLSDDEIDALAAYHHGDIAELVIVSSEAVAQARDVTPRTFKLGSFGMVLWPMVYDLLVQQGVGKPTGPTGGEQEEEVKPSVVAQSFTPVINLLRMVNTGPKLL